MSLYAENETTLLFLVTIFPSVVWLHFLHSYWAMPCTQWRYTVIITHFLIGLSRAFLAAGAACVIVTLWKIDDKPASELMTSFYREYKASRDAAVSLQKSMKTLQTKEDTRSPQHWAAFSIVGATGLK